MRGLVDLAVFIAASYAALFAAYTFFVVARGLVTALARVPERLPPFGEAPVERLAQTSILTRLAVTLAGPAAVYLLVTAVSTIGLYGTDVYDETNTVVDIALPSGPAAAAGVRDGDRITAVAGEPVAKFIDVSTGISSHPGESIDLAVERDGQILHLTVTPGPVGSRMEGRIGVRQRPGLADFRTALRIAAARPLEIVVGRAQTAGARLVELSGPVAIEHETNPRPRRSRALELGNAAGLIGAAALEGFVLVALFMFPLRRRRAEPPAGEPAPPLAAVSPPRPWLRFAARLVDVAVLGLLIGLVLIAIDPHLPDAVGAGFILLSIPLEAALLASWGSTPGKWLLEISVRDAAGRKLRFGAALRRTAAAWLYGLGLSEGVGLVTNLLAFRRLRRHGATYWDALDGHRVTHDDVGEWRAIVAAVIIMALFAFIALVTFREFRWHRL